MTHKIYNFICSLVALIALAGSPAARGVDVAGLKDGVYAAMKTTAGEILIQLEYEKCPLTVANFVGLAEGTKHYARWDNLDAYMADNYVLNAQKRPIGLKEATQKPKAQNKPYYDGLVFHRVIGDFMIQGGCPFGVGMGGPGYKFEDEFDPSLKHTGAGILSMANSGKATNGSQFFITLGPTPHLNGKHTVFGHVVQGMDVVDAVGKTKTGARDVPVTPQVIESVKILRVGEKAAQFKGDEAAFQSYSGK